MVWFDDLEVTHPDFEAIQMAALRGVYPMSVSGLHSSPEAPITRAEAASALTALFGKQADAAGWMAVDHRNWFHPDLPFYWTDLREDKLPKALPPLRAHRTGPVRRSEFARRFLDL
jgi:hypothetical protein